MKTAAVSVAIPAALIALDVNPAIVSILGSVCLLGILILGFQLTKHHLERSIAGGYEEEPIYRAAPQPEPVVMHGRRFNPITDRVSENPEKGENT